jgi:nucleoside-diphosphate-sugar epimerase
METQMEQKVLILGARGRLGAAASSAFAQAGWQVIAQARRPIAANGNVRFIATALADTAGLARDAAGSNTVLYAANPAYTNASWARDAQPMLDCAIAIARRLNATLLFPGNVYNFGADMPEQVQETSPQAATPVKGKIRVAMERSLQDATAQGLQSVVLRAGDFFGAGRGTWLDQAMVKNIAKGRFVYPALLHVPHAWAYLPDLARAFVAVAQARGRLPGFTTLHFAGHTLTGQDWIDALEPLAHAQGWLQPAARLKAANLPWSLLRTGGLLVPTWRSLTEMQYLWNTPHALAGDEYVRQIGAAPHTPFAQALRAALQDLGLLRATPTATATPAVPA